MYACMYACMHVSICVRVLGDDGRLEITTYQEIKLTYLLTSTETV